MLGPLFRGIRRAERNLQENSRVGMSEFERKPSLTWTVIGLIIIGIIAYFRHK
jgi:hypothetical protein